MVGPGHVVGGAGGEDLDLRVAGHVLGHQAAVVLGPARDVQAVALDHEGQLQAGARSGRRLAAAGRRRRFAAASSR